jgi:ankyrin repeat protein
MSKKIKSKIRGYSRLNSAIIHKNYIQMRTLLRSKVNINDMNSTAQPSIECAIECKDPYAIKILAKYGGDINKTDDNGNNFLMKCGNNNDKVVKTLIYLKVNLNHRNKNNDTPLTYLLKHKYKTNIIEKVLEKNGKNRGMKNGDCLSGIKDSDDDLEMLEFLLKKGININTQDHTGQTPLMIALRKGHNRKARMLIDHKCKVNIKDKNGVYPIMMTEDSDTIMYLVKSMACLDYRDRNGNCILQKSVKIDIDLTNKLLDLGTSPHVKNNLEYNMITSTILSIHNGVSKDLLTRLIKMDVDVNSPDIFGRTPLMYAIQMSKTKLVTFLMKHGASVTDKDKDGYCPFMYSINSDLSDGTIRSILKKRDPKTLKTNKGVTPLMLASSCGNLKKVFRFIRDENCALDLDDYGNNFVMHFVNYCQPTNRYALSTCVMIYPMISYWADYTLVNKHNYDLFLISFSKGNQQHFPSARKMLEKAPINNKYYNGETILTRIVYLYNLNHDTFILKELLKHVKNGELEINSKNHKGNTVMHIAVKKNATTYVKHLLKAKARIDIKNKNGDTPIDMAKKDNPSILHLLISH